jgi:hypothetical protein
VHFYGPLSANLSILLGLVVFVAVKLREPCQRGPFYTPTRPFLLLYISLKNNKNGKVTMVEWGKYTKRFRKIKNMAKINATPNHGILLV